MDRLRVAFLLKTNDGGRWIVPQAEELRRRGHEVVAILPPGSGGLATRLTERGFPVIESPFNFRFRPDLATLRGLWRLRRLVRRLQPDVLKYHLYPSALAARLSTIGLPLRRAHMVVGPLFLESAVIRTVERALWRLDDVTICGTRHMSRIYGGFGCPAVRRPVVTAGIDIARFDPARPEHLAGDPGGYVPAALTRAESRAKARADLGIAEDVFLVLMVAYVYEPKRLVNRRRGHKGHDVLLAAWSAFHARHPRSHLLLIGAGLTEAGERHRQELVRRFAVDTDPSVTWTGSVDDVRPCYRAADLSVSPSLAEGHGAAAEADAMAVPSIVSDAGGLPEALDENSGWVVPRGDASALADALETAYREFRDGRLAVRGTYARRHAERVFDNRKATGRVADIVEHVGAGTRRL